jgi:TatD DNase family protein
MHCFTGSKEFAHKLLDIGCYFSASGIITFKKATELTETFKSIPNNKILIETDSPYLSPEPLRGKTNEPSHIIHTLKYISKIKKETEKSVASFTGHNFSKLFNLSHL